MLPTHEPPQRRAQRSVDWLPMELFAWWKAEMAAAVLLERADKADAPKETWRVSHASNTTHFFIDYNISVQYKIRLAPHSAAHHHKHANSRSCTSIEASFMLISGCVTVMLGGRVVPRLTYKSPLAARAHLFW